MCSYSMCFPYIIFTEFVFSYCGAAVSSFIRLNPIGGGLEIFLGKEHVFCVDFTGLNHSTAC